jgi:hypothetical protein
MMSMICATIKQHCWELSGVSNRRPRGKQYAVTSNFVDPAPSFSKCSPYLADASIMIGLTTRSQGRTYAVLDEIRLSCDY